MWLQTNLSLCLEGSDEKIFSYVEPVSILSSYPIYHENDQSFREFLSLTCSPIKDMKQIPGYEIYM